MTPLRRSQRPRASIVVLISTAALLASAGCASSSGGHAAPAPASTSTAAPASTSTPTTTPGCVSQAEIAGWPITRRAAQLVVLPVLNFGVGALAPRLGSGVGGILFLGPAGPPSDLRAQLAAATGGLDRATAPLVMADVEGGGIQRLPGAVAAFPWPREMAATLSVRATRSLAENVGRQIAGAGVNVDLAPVLDLDDRPGPSTTNPDGRRSFSLDPTTASAYGIAFMQGLLDAGVVPVLKHFPGLGGSTENTDDGSAATLPLAQLQKAGLQPFADAIAAKAPAVMVSNAYVPGLTSMPASVSGAVVTGLLRRQLGFSGLVMTDSLSAGAISQAGLSVPQATVAAIEAGVDVVLFGSTLTPAATALLSPANVQASLDAIVGALVAAAKSGALTATRINDAVAHVLRAKGVTLC